MDRTLLIGIDGATFTVLDGLMADGTMPFLKEFVQQGVRSHLRSTPNPLTPPAWTSLVTGRTPGNHGIFDFIRAEEGPQGLYFTLNTSDDIRCETIWSLISRQGGSISCLNFPVSFPPFHVNGYVIPGFVSWKHLRRSVYPSDFFKVLQEIPGFDVKELSMDMNEEFQSIQWLPPEDYAPWIEHHIRRERQWFGVVRDLLQKSPTDLVSIIFDGADKLQHLCWRFLDPELFPLNPTEWEQAVREQCLEYFRELDGFLREIVALAGSEARVFIVSDHGFCATQDLFYANVWLEKEGYLFWNAKAMKDQQGKVGSDSIKNHVVGIDWSRTSAYALSPSSNGIFLRDPNMDPPNALKVQKEKLQSEIKRKLLDVIHPKTGKPFLQKVMTREEAFPGMHTEAAPDLTLVFHDHGFLSVLNADDPIQFRPEPAGTHHPHGIFLAAGKNIAKGRQISLPSIEDVGPTLLYSIGMPIPSDFEGTVISECFESDFLSERPVVMGKATDQDAGDVKRDQSEAMGSEEEEKVIERLRALGYLE